MEDTSGYDNARLDSDEDDGGTHKLGNAENFNGQIFTSLAAWRRGLNLTIEVSGAYSS